MAPSISKERVNVAHLGLCFMVLFSADFTMNYLQKTITSSISEEKPSYHIEGYWTLAVTYFVYGISLWLSPSVLAHTGPKILFVFSSLFYALHPLSFIAEEVWVTYTVLCLAGMAGSLLWVSHGIYIINVSSSGKALSTNIALFWVLYSLAMIPGNIFVAFQLQGKKKLDVKTRSVILVVLGSIALVASVMFCFLRPAKDRSEGSVTPPPMSPGPMKTITITWHVFTSPDMLILIFTFIYTGFQQSFGSGVMGATIGFTSDLGPSNKQLIPISALCYGAGEITGGVVQVMTGSRITGKWRRSGLLLIGVTLQLMAYSVFVCALPDTAVFADTNQPSFLQDTRFRLPLILGSSALVGLGDSTLNSQIYPLIADLHPGLSSHSCALYKFTKSMAMAVYFVISSEIGLYSQAGLLAISGAAGVCAYILVDQRNQRQKQSENL